MIVLGIFYRGTEALAGALSWGVYVKYIGRCHNG